MEAVEELNSIFGGCTWLYFAHPQKQTLSTPTTVSCAAQAEAARAAARELQALSTAERNDVMRAVAQVRPSSPQHVTKVGISTFFLAHIAGTT